MGKAIDPKAIKRWMKSHAQEHVDAKTNEVNATALVEAWDRECATGGDTLDSDHIAWEIGAEVATWWEKEHKS